MNEILKKIEETIQKKAWSISVMQKPRYDQGRHDMAYECLDTIKEIIQAEKKKPTYEQLKYANDLQIDIIKRLEKSNQDLSDRVVIAEGLVSQETISEKTNFDVITETPAKMINYFFHLMRQTVENSGYEFEIEPDMVEKLIDYLSQKAESRE
jgi:hypothetical protein